jgi:HEPN domain-containing protein
MPIADWQLYRQHGEQFLRTAQGAFAKDDGRFTAEAIYNICAMAMEKLVMAFLMRRGDLAENHTMADLLRALHRHIQVPATLAEGFVFIDDFQRICDLDTQVRRRPSHDQLARMLATAAALAAFLASDLTD